MSKLTHNERSRILELAQSILDRFERDRLTRAHLLHLDELPAISGVYFATTEDKQTLYIGKASDFTIRCNISIHHKLPTAIEKGAVFLHIANVSSELAWYVEQVLIDQLRPVLNGQCSQWWIKQVSEDTFDVTDNDFVDLELRTINFLNSGKTFTSVSPEIQQFFAFVKQHRNAYKAYYGLTITEKTSAIDAFSRFCKFRLGLSFKSRKKGGRGKQILYYWLDIDAETKCD